MQVTDSSRCSASTIAVMIATDIDGDDCKHGLAPGTCAACKETSPDGLAAGLSFDALRRATEDLGAGGTEFKTTDVAAHPVVLAAHPSLLMDPQFRQLVGIRLAGESGGLGLQRVSRAGVAPAVWRRADANSAPSAG